MDMPYRTSTSRNNDRADRLSRDNRDCSNQKDIPRQPPVISPRKRVNIVNFRPTPSPTHPSSDDSIEVLPTPLKHARTELPANPTEELDNIPRQHENPPSVSPLISPKFKRRVGHPRNGVHNPATSQQPKPTFSKSLSKIVPPASTINQKSEADPYAWVEDEPDPKPSGLAVRRGDDDGDEVDDGIKPWFWPASRDVAIAPAEGDTKHPSKGLGVESRTKKIYVPRDQKALYTVVEKVRDPLVCQERGGMQHALDDMNYLIDGLSDSNSTHTRCLSILKLAKKCLTPATRDLIYAYGLLKQICINLHDAHTDYSLGLTAAGLFFVLSRDRDPDLLSSESLVMLLKLLHSPNEPPASEPPPLTGSSKYTIGGTSHRARHSKEAGQVRSLVQQLLETVALQQQKSRKKLAPPKSPQPLPKAGLAALFVRKKPGLTSMFSVASGQMLLDAKHLRMNRQLMARDLILEAILNWATRKSPNWFKVTIGKGGGLDGIASAAVDAIDYLKDLCSSAACYAWQTRFYPTASTEKNPTGLDDFSLDNLKRVGHYAKMLENMTYMNPENQAHLVRYKERVLVDRLVQCIHLCASRLSRHPPPSVNWGQLLRTESREAQSPARNPLNDDDDESRGHQPPTSSSTEGEARKATTAPHLSAPEGCQQDQQTLLTCLLAIFRLFVNVSQSEFVSDRLGGCPGLLEATLDCLFHLPDNLPSSQRLDMLILTLCLLANLCEHCSENRIRIVHLEIPSFESISSAAATGTSEADVSGVGYEDDRELTSRDSHKLLELPPSNPTISALDEIVKLFLFREKKTLMHEFEREEEDQEEGNRIRHSVDPRKADLMGEADSTTVTTLQRPKPPPSMLAGGDITGETIEEAGLKWRLVGRNKHINRRFASADNQLAGGLLSTSSKRSRLRAKRRRRRLAMLRRSIARKMNSARSDGEDDDDDDDEEEEEKDDCAERGSEGVRTDEEDFSDDYDNDEHEEEEDDDDDEEEDDDDDDDDGLCGGADVEFVTETQEEQEKLKERMSSANQHMEDSVVAAYAALLLGCILQSSPRYAERIRSLLPAPGKFRPLAIMLAKLVSFLSLARGVETAGSESILRIVRTLEAQDQPLTSTSIGSSTVEPPMTRSSTRSRHG